MKEPLLEGPEDLVGGVAVGEIDVHASGEGLSVGGDDVLGRAVRGVQLGDGFEVGDDQTGKVVLVAKQTGEQVVRSGDGAAVEVVVRRHHSPCPAFADSHFKWASVHLSKLSLSDVGRLRVPAAVARAVADEVLERGDDGAVGDGSLDASDEGRGDLSDEVRVLTVCLAHPSPARVLSDIGQR